MIKYFLKSFKILNENIILTTPLVLFILILSVYLGVANNVPQNIFVAILLLITIVSMFAAFFAGWFYMVKKAIVLDEKDFIADEEKTKASFNLMKEIPTGIGEYFLSFVGAIVIYTTLSLVLTYICYIIGINLIGKLNIDINRLKIALDSTQALKAFIGSLSVEELVKINKWYMLSLGFISFFYYITMFWGAEIISKTKNPLLAFFKSVGFTFKNFLSTLILFIYITVLNFTVSAVTTFSAVNPILYFVTTLISFYFVVYYVVLVFLYYDQTNKSKTENNCDCGTDCSGENCLCNPESFDE